MLERLLRRASRRGNGGRAAPIGLTGTGTPRFQIGTVDRSHVKHVQQHELDTADRLARRGHRVVFRPPDAEGVRSADVLLDGKKVELKSPLGDSRNAITQNIRDARRQSNRVVIDLHRTDLDDEQAITWARQAFERYGDIRELTILGKTRTVRWEKTDG